MGKNNQRRNIKGYHGGQIINKREGYCGEKTSEVRNNKVSQQQSTEKGKTSEVRNNKVSQQQSTEKGDTE